MQYPPCDPNDPTPGVVPVKKGLAFEGQKVACNPCMKGHRSSSCRHKDRILYYVRAAGRPLSSCPHPRAIKCNCSANSERVIAIIPRSIRSCACPVDKGVPEIPGSCCGPNVVKVEMNMAEVTPSARQTFKISKNTSRRSTSRNQSMDTSSLARTDMENFNVHPCVGHGGFSSSSHMQGPFQNGFNTPQSYRITSVWNSQETPPYGTPSPSIYPSHSPQSPEQYNVQYGYQHADIQVQPYNPSVVAMNHRAPYPNHAYNLPPVQYAPLSHQHIQYMNSPPVQYPSGATPVRALEGPGPSVSSSSENGYHQQYNGPSSSASVGTPSDAAPSPFGKDPDSSDKSVSSEQSESSEIITAEPAETSRLCRASKRRPEVITEVQEATKNVSTCCAPVNTPALPEGSATYGTQYLPATKETWEASLLNQKQTFGADCSCGAGCTCIGCLIHPFNAETIQTVHDDYQQLKGQQAPIEVVEGTAATDDDEEDSMVNYDVLDPSGYLFVDYCFGDQGGCPCGPDCACPGCIVHGENRAASSGQGRLQEQPIFEHFSLNACCQ
ncbi:hypothetical protein BJ878DRAFT_572739 [Calycina marina]|uniref:Copper-fist domain-containing protein n=1 Tax=Calycina marina TaxID=1763456 RepID=A0A9P7Z9L0_9HELO|nr:hypothetical protein BJ878DRAFT_572739 [Calycina marina]